MPPDETDTFPEELKLENFARLRCRSAWSAYETAKGEIPADAGGSRRLAGDYHSSVTNVGWLAPRNQIDPQIAKARARVEQAWRALCDNVIKELKSVAFEVRGVPRGEYVPVIIWSALLSSMRIVNLKKSIISTVGNRRFESVHVFPAETKAPAVGAELHTEKTGAVYSIAKAGAAGPLLSMDDLSVGERAILCAVNELWGGKIPTLLKGRQRDKKIMDYLKSRSDLSQVGSSTIKRFLKKYHDAAKRQRATDRPRKSP